MNDLIQRIANAVIRQEGQDCNSSGTQMASISSFG